MLIYKGKMVDLFAGEPTSVDSEVVVTESGRVDAKLVDCLGDEVACVSVEFYDGKFRAYLYHGQIEGYEDQEPETVILWEDPLSTKKKKGGKKK